jgi:hypothetical protein
VLFARKVSEGTEHSLKCSYLRWTKHHRFCLKSASEKNLASSWNFDLIPIFDFSYYEFWQMRSLQKSLEEKKKALKGI